MVNPKLKKAPQPQRTPKKLTVTVSRTIQLKQYWPVSISLTEEHELEDGEDARTVRNQVYKQLSNSVQAYLDREVENYEARGEK